MLFSRNSLCYVCEMAVFRTFLCLLWLLPGWLHAEAVRVQGVRLWQSPERVRVVLDLNGKPDYRLFTLKAPERVVVDLEAARLDADLKLPKNDWVTALRHGKRGHDGLRLVLDLNHPVRPKSFVLPPQQQYPHRLVLDLEPVSGTRAATRESVSKSTAKKVEEQGRDVLIAVDAGHGGEDAGAIGAKGTREKQVTLAIARELVRQINEQSGMRAFLVRKGDYYIPLKKRYQIARQRGADLFISIHADAFYNRKVKGSSVFVLSPKGASSEAARWLARKENDADLIGGVRLDEKDDLLATVLLDLSQSATRQASQEVAEGVLQALGRVNPLHTGHVEKANFVVLRSPDMPSVLVETAFISNPREEKRLKSARHQKRLAQAIIEGARNYFEKRPPAGTWFAQRRKVRTHVVSRGETLSGIAQQYRVPLGRLKQFNQLKTDRIAVGKVLKIPASNG